MTCLLIMAEAAAIRRPLPFLDVPAPAYTSHSRWRSVRIAFFKRHSPPI